MSEKVKKCPNCNGPMVTTKPEVVSNSVGRKSVRHHQFCLHCRWENELDVEQYCPCCEAYLGD